jgi:hypothetical protein
LERGGFVTKKLRRIHEYNVISAETTEERGSLPSYDCVTTGPTLSASKFFVSFVSFVVSFHRL